MIKLLKRIFGLASDKANAGLDEIEGVERKTERLIKELKDSVVEKRTAVAKFSAFKIELDERNGDYAKDLKRAEANLDKAISSGNEAAQLAYAEDIEAIEQDIASTNEQLARANESLDKMREQIDGMNEQVTNAERIGRETAANATLNKASKAVGSAFANDASDSIYSQLKSMSDKTKMETNTLDAYEDLSKGKNSKVKSEFEKSQTSDRAAAIIAARKAKQ